MGQRKRNLYDVLGVCKDATPEQIKSAFRRRAKAAHPDAGGSVEAFGDVKRAELVLLDPERRARYDSTGDAEEIEPDRETARVFELIARLLAAVIDDDDHEPSRHDLVGVIKGALQRNVAGLREKQHKLQRGARRVEKLAGRFKTRGRDNTLERMVAAHAETLRREEINILQAISDHQKAIEIVGTHTFEVEQVSPHSLGTGLGGFDFWQPNS